MSSGRKSALPFVVGGVAIAGTLAAHFIDYFIFAPDPQHRALLLHATGHGYLGHLIPLTVLGGVLAVAATVWLGSARARGANDERPRIIPTGAVLAAAQVTGFAMLEIGERLVSGAGFERAWPHLFALGILVQIAVAVAGALVLVLLDRGAEKVTAALLRRRVSPRHRGIRLRNSGRAVISRFVEPSITGRGPPFATAPTP